MAIKNPKAILDKIVKDGEVQDVMLLRKAAVAFANLTVKGYVGNRFGFVNRLKTDMTKERSIPMSVMTQVKSSMEMWDCTMNKFQTISAKEEDWTSESGVSMTNTLLNMASELEDAHTAMANVWEAVKKARKLEVAAATKAKNSTVKATNEAFKPFIKNGLDGSWKGLLFNLNLVTTGSVDSHAASQQKVDSSVMSVNWARPQYWLTIEGPESGDCAEDKQGLR